jgi:TRAP-type C4-dicarboxylate transport system permease small subunit
MNLGNRLDTLLGAIGAVVLFGMMSLTFVDVILRYGFNASLRGAFEITELMMVILIYAGLPVVSRNDLHVTTDLIDRFLAARVRRTLDVAVHLVCALVLFGAAWLVWIKAGRTARLGDVTAALHLTLAPYVYLMCALILVTAVIHLVKAFLPGTGHGGSNSV